MGETCLPDELRTLFLFEKLTDEQLQMLCDNGHIAVFEPGPVCIEGDPATCFYVHARRRTGDVQALRRRRHRDQPHLAARRVLRRVVGIHPRRGTRLRGIGAGDQAVPVLRAGRGRVRAVHEDRVPDGRASARGPHGRRPTADARSSASARSCWRSAPSPPASPTSSTTRRRPPHGRSPTCARASARCGTSWRCWPTASSPRRRCGCW